VFCSPKNIAFFHSKLLLENCKFHITRDERVVSEIEGKTIFFDAPETD